MSKSDMSYVSVLQWFEENPDAKPNDLTDEMAVFMRAAHSGQIPTPADFLAQFYILHLKHQDFPLPKTPADYSVEFVERANDFFNYVGYRCLYSQLNKEEMVTYQDPDVVLLASDVKHELKHEVTEKGKEAFEDFQKQLEKAYKDAVEQQKKQTAEKRKDEDETKEKDTVEE